MLHRLRIAASVFFALVTVALCVLWVRSYWSWDSLEKRTSSRILRIDSERGVLTGSQTHPKPFKDLDVLLDHLSQGRTYISEPSRGESLLGVKRSALGFGWSRTGVTTQAAIPIWFMVVICAAVSASLPFFRISYRFSLRTMLIATTLVAVVLGLVVWMGR